MYVCHLGMVVDNREEDSLSKIAEALELPALKISRGWFEKTSGAPAVQHNGAHT